MNQYHKRLMRIIDDVKHLDIWSIIPDLNRPEQMVMHAIDRCSRTDLPQWKDIHREMRHREDPDEIMEKCRDAYMNVSGSPGEGTRNVRVSDLVLVTRMHMSAISRALKELEAKGLITRHTDSADRRQTIVQLTDEGRKMVARDTREIDDYIEAVFAAFTEEEQEELIRLLTKMKDSAAEELEIRRKRV